MLYAIFATTRKSRSVRGRGSRMSRDGPARAGHGRTGAQGRLGPVARLQATTAAATVRVVATTPVIDGPFAETKEQLLGFYVVDCASLQEATELAKQLVEPPGCMEVRPVHTYWPPSLAT